MAHFAELDNDNIVLRVIVVANDDIMENGVESEAKGVVFCEALFGGRWVQASYNNNFRKHYPGAGFMYDKNLDAFVPPKPYDSWVLNEDCVWEAPKPYPDLNKAFIWDESAGDWVEVERV